jgi:glucose 1-dehydrogenase
VVTGAARGIGAAIVNLLVDAGVDVVAVDKDKNRLVAAFGGRDHDCKWVHADLYQQGGKAVAERVLREHGPVQLIVNNVGISTERDFFDITEEDFDQVFDTNARAPFFFTKRLVEELIRDADIDRDAGKDADRCPTPGLGAVLFISSVHDTIPAAQPPYSASKAAVRMFTGELARRLGRYGIRVNAISPGWIRTNEHPDSFEQRMKAQALEPRIPLGRAGDAAEVARLALFLLSETCASYITGSTIRVDGGLSLDTWVGNGSF